MICPYCKITVYNYETEAEVVKPLPAGGITTDEVYETWQVIQCGECGRRWKEAYRCELIQGKQ